MTENIIQLSNGAYAKLRPPADIPEGLRRPILKGQSLLADFADKDEKDFTGEDVVRFLEFADLLILAFVVRWTVKARDEDGQEVGDVLPISIDSLKKMRGGDVDTLRNAVAPLAKQVTIDFGASFDPQSPTEPSTGSSTSSVEGQSTDATPSLMSSVSGES